MMEYDMNILEEIQDCPVEWKELGEVAFLKRGKTITSKTATDGPYPVISGGQKPAYFHGEFNREGETITVAGSGAYAGFVMYWNEPIFVSDAFSIKAFDRILSSKFLYHYLLEKQGILFSLKKGSGVPHVYPKDVSRISIPIPPLEIQEKIVQTLDKFTDYVTELTSELTSRKKQYSFYRDKLLSFEDEVYQVEWKMLSECLKKGKGTKITAGQMKLLHKDGAPIRIFAGGKTYADVSYGDIPDKDIHTEEAIIVKSRGIIDFEYCTKPFSFKNEFWSYSSDNENINLRYIYHYLVHDKEHFQNIANNMQMPQISSNDTEKFKIPVPSLEIQSRIVQVLDNFDMVCNDLNIGLPKEIELRQKQYEYFREKLLTFVAEGEYTESRVE